MQGGAIFVKCPQLPGSVSGASLLTSAKPHNVKPFSISPLMNLPSVRSRVTLSPPYRSSESMHSPVSHPQVTVLKKASKSLLSLKSPFSFIIASTKISDYFDFAPNFGVECRNFIVHRSRSVGIAPQCRISATPDRKIGFTLTPHTIKVQCRDFKGSMAVLHAARGYSSSDCMEPFPSLLISQYNRHFLYAEHHPAVDTLQYMGRIASEIREPVKQRLNGNFTFQTS